jgi:Flp pilus assembly protein TadD
MIAGKNAFEGGNAAGAVAEFSRSVKVEPTQADAHLNLANAYLFAGDTAKTIAEGEEVLRLNANSAAALYVIGCAQLRQGNAEAALKALQQSRFIDPTVSAVSFQIGHAHLKLGQGEAAVAAFRDCIALEPQHPSAHYALSQALMRVKDTAAAQTELATHQAIIAGRKSVVNDPTYFEKCVHTRALLPAVTPEYPDATGVRVSFSDVTEEVFDAPPGHYVAPAVVVDVVRDWHPSIVALEPGKGFRLLANDSGKFKAFGDSLPGLAEGRAGTRTGWRSQQ